jgi:hypothetical protein
MRQQRIEDAERGQTENQARLQRLRQQVAQPMAQPQFVAPSLRMRRNDFGTSQGSLISRPFSTQLPDNPPEMRRQIDNSIFGEKEGKGLPVFKEIRERGDLQDMYKTKMKKNKLMKSLLGREKKPPREIKMDKEMLDIMNRAGWVGYI